jgi:hypothetical protein
MNEQERAEEHLRTIRRLMERATIYRAISAPTALVGGLLSLVASYLTFVCSIPSSVDYWDLFGFSIRKNGYFFFCLWLLVLLLTAGTNTLFIVLGARKRNEPVFSASMKAALVALAPALILGAAITCCSAGSAFDSSLYFYLGIIWTACYGLGLLATSHFAPRSLTLLGWAFLLSSIIGTVYLSLGGDNDDFGDRSALPCAAFMALTFGLFHLIYAACAWPRKGAAPEL